jgi:thymidine kinase
MEHSEGYLEIILGPMFSGKTTALIQQYKKYTYIGKRVAVINYQGDTRYHDSLLSTHDKVMIPCIFSDNLASVDVDEKDVILINEGQFFSDIFEKVIEWVDNYKKTVIICGLDGDFQRNKFGRLLDLIPYCNDVIKFNSLCALCRNGKSGVFSHRVSNETSQIVIGADNYIPLCRQCYLREQS